MAITTFAELKTALANWLNRADLTSRIPEFIALAEARLNREGRLRVVDAVARSTLSVSSQFTNLPSDFAQMINCELQTTPVTLLEYATPQHLDAVRNQYSSGADPDYFTIVGNELEVAPVPTSAVTLGIQYYKRIVALSDSATSNWLLASAPDIYLYASLMEAAPYLHEDERVPVWEQMFAMRLDAYRDSSERDQAADSPLVMRGDVIW